MYISQAESHELDGAVKSFEVALRSFISDVLMSAYPDAKSFNAALQSISISNQLIYSKRFSAKLKALTGNAADVHAKINKCRQAYLTNSFDNDVPYVSDLIDFLLIFFNAHFSNKNIVKDFSSVEEFHYCCTLYHKVRNNLSHPASHPVTLADANKVVYLIENIIASLEDKYFWYCSKVSIESQVTKYKHKTIGALPRAHNLDSARSTHSKLLCRESEIAALYTALLGNDVRQRLAGSVVLYGYGGVGKTAVTTEFLYRLLRDKKDGRFSDLDYLLFFTSKDEYLREHNTTGELYIDSIKPEFSNLSELKGLICSVLKIDDIQSLTKCYGRGIIAIDNIENIEQSEKNKIIDFIKSLPRSVQFIVTSRNEEACEEKIHIKEFKNDNSGIEFVENIIDSEGFDVELDRQKIEQLLNASKGNALIIVQVLNILHRGVSTFDSIRDSLESMRSKNSEMIASFMYKNTFDTALQQLKENGFPATEVMQIISLYDERIELYSISKLSKIDISDAEKICNFLLERLVLVKAGEYYELNEFARRFVFIKLLPDRFELSNIKDKIKSHKERMKKKLSELDSTLDGNSILQTNVAEWQPRNYIDKIVIAELFSLYGEAIKCVSRKDREGYEKKLKELNDHSFITNHPYVPLQKARLLKEGTYKFYRGDATVLSQVEHAYEEAIESVEYDYRYLIGTKAHGSLLMYFGVFLCLQMEQYGRSIRFLENAKNIFEGEKVKPWLICCNSLSIACERKYIETNDKVYRDHLIKVVKQVLSPTIVSDSRFDIERYRKRFSKWLKPDGSLKETAC